MFEKSDNKYKKSVLTEKKDFALQTYTYNRNSNLHISIIPWEFIHHSSFWSFQKNDKNKKKLNKNN